MSGAKSEDPWSALTIFAYALGIFLFTLGLGAYLRARTSTAMVSRVLLFTILFGITAGPWIFAVIAALLTDGSSRSAYALAAPSPFYVLMMIDAIRHVSSDVLILAGIAAIAIWAALGALFLVLARRRCATIIAKHEAMLAETDRILDAEDAAEQRGAGITEEPPPPEAVSSEVAPGAV